MRCDPEWLREWVPKVPMEGEAIAQVLTLAGLEAELQEDGTLELELTPNRGDCLSMLGLAREVSVLTRSLLEEPRDASSIVVSEQVAIPTLGAIQVDACPYYSLRLIEDIDAEAATPQWMQDRLVRCGMRPHDFLVDVTNYVMLELGQPLHAFDADAVNGPISVRWAQTQESMRALDDTLLVLEPDMLVIASGNQPLAVAGVIGGASSAVSTETRRVLLEAAHFSPSAITGRARRLKLHTESSRRFERGVDPHQTRRALQRATQLIVEHAGGQVSHIAQAGNLAPEFHSDFIPLRAARLEQCLGTKIAATEVSRILQDLGCVITAKAEQWEVLAPSWRFDIAIEEDLIEEVARVYGYDRIPSLPLPPSALPARPAITDRIEQYSNRLVERGYSEAVTYSFTEEKLEEMFASHASPWRLRNPISEDYAVLRSTLSASLLRAVQYNRNRQQDSVRLFEVARVFAQNEEGNSETLVLGGVACGLAYPVQWGAAAREIDFYDVKGDLESLFEDYPDQLRFEPATHPTLHPGQTASVLLGGKEVGLIGVLHPKWMSEFDLSSPVVVFELMLQEWAEPSRSSFSAWSEYPAVERDLNVVVAESVTAAQVETCVRDLGMVELTECTIFDVYRGRNLRKGCKSFGLRLIFQSTSGTLTDPEVDVLAERITAELAQQLKATLRQWEKH